MLNTETTQRSRTSPNTPAGQTQHHEKPGLMGHFAAALDVGSTALKAALFDLEALPHPQTVRRDSLPIALHSPAPAWSEHDLETASRAFEKLLGQLPSEVPVGLSSAMHALVPLDAQGRALCPAISWADGRSSEQARALKREFSQLEQSTGTPLHPMAWPAKLLWLKEERPQWWDSAALFLDLKSYLLGRWSGAKVPLDLSSASGTGLWDQAKGDWSAELLDYLELDRNQLPAVSLDASFSLSAKGRRFFLGAGDGPLGNLGTGAVLPGRTALSLGTSGACRRFSDSWQTPPQGLFRYHLGPDSWVEGGAISNGGSVLQRLCSQTGQSAEQLLSYLDSTEPGSGGLRVYPYFQGERAPFWLPDLAPSEQGRRPEQGVPQELRAHLEGVAYCLHRLLRMMPSSSEALRCTGGMFSSQGWSQLLADVTGQAVAVSPVEDATALGAALMTQADYLERSSRLPLGALTRPHEARHERYRRLYEEWASGDPYASRAL